MPNCFQLIGKETGEATAFAKIDNEMRVHFNQPPDPKNYLAGWYDSIGFLLASGKSFQEIRELYQGYIANPEEVCGTHWPAEDVVQCYTDLLRILEYLEERYTNSAWYELKH